jgi:hypothetical protein
MRIVFGWNSFRIRSFSPEELGVFQKEALSVNIEVRQAYFHIFWIPFFSLGKRWVIRKDNQLYELPAELKPHVKAIARVKTPWYTFTGPILGLIIALGFWFQNENDNKRYHESSVAYFNADNAILEEQLKYITTKDIITLQEINPDWHDKLLYLKIEDIHGDSIIVTPVESNSDKPMDVEQAYNRYANSTASVRISYKQLASAYPRIFDSSSSRSALTALAKNLLGDGKVYIVKDVVRHFGPFIFDAQGGSYERDISIRLFNKGWPAIVTDVKTLQGTIDWSQNINKAFPGYQNEGGPYFFLYGKNYKVGEPYKLVMTLKDTGGQIIKYEIEGQGPKKTIRQL